MKRSSVGIQKEPTIMIIPMIDIVFFLLVFFMMSTLYMNTEEQIPLNLPKPLASTAKTIEPITISLTATHKMYLNEREIRLMIWAMKFKASLRRNHNRLLSSVHLKILRIRMLLAFWII